MMPGLFLDWRGPCTTETAPLDLAAEVNSYHGAHRKSVYCLNVDEWFRACSVTSNSSTNAQHRGSDGASVLFDGYLSDIVLPGKSAACIRGGHADRIAYLYREHGRNFTQYLRGSYCGVVVDEAAGKATVFLDRHGSRPLFERTVGSDNVRMAPQDRYLADVSPKLSRLNEGAVGQFLLRGSFYRDDTLFEGVRRIPLGTSICFTKREVKYERYWRLSFNHAREASSSKEALDELDALASTAIPRTLEISKSLTLCLSGGADSRLLLGYFMPAGANDIHTFTYAVEPHEGDEAEIATKVAERCKVPHELFVTKLANLVAHAKTETIATDGRVIMLDDPSNRWDYLGEHFDLAILGAQCFGWKDKVDNFDAALESVAYWNFDGAPRVSDWLKHDVALRISDSIRKTLLDMRSADTDLLSANDFKERVSLEERAGNL